MALTGCADKPVRPVKIDWASMQDEDARDWPDNLSEWNLLSIQGGKLTPLLGVEPYQLNTPLFTDYALKLRTLWLPEATSLTLAADGQFDFPVGAVLSKTFYYESSNSGASKPVKARRSSAVALAEVELNSNRLIETRLLVNTSYGWVGLPYIWNAEQTEATLEIAGGRASIELSGANGESQTFSYGVPNILECAGCHAPNHSDKSIKPIGPSLANLNIAAPYPGADQLQRFTSRGWLKGGWDTQAALVRWDDQAKSVEERAKAYLQVNCAHCHNSVGAADTSGLYLNSDNPNGSSYGLCKPPVAAGKGSGGRLVDIHPGAPEKSILSYRLHSIDPGEMMPEIGRTIVHAEGVALVDEWIASLSGSCSTGGQ